MAALGARKLTRGGAASKKSPDAEASSVGLLPMNLIISPILVQPIATVGFERPALGGAIMREGFTTETGPLTSANLPRIGSQA